MAAFSDTATEVLRSGKILGPDDLPDTMIDRVWQRILSVEFRFGVTETHLAALHQRFADYMTRKLVMPGTPMLTNALQSGERALGFCVTIPVDLRQPLSCLNSSIEAYYEHTMGSGFDLDELEDPVAAVVALNDHAMRLTAAKAYERYIGTMANIGVAVPS